MNIDDCYKLVFYIAGKNQGGNISPERFNLLIKSANSEYQSFVLGQVEQFQYNNPKARVELGNNELVTSKLSPFISTPLTIAVNGNGKATYPNDYVERVALYTSTDKKIRWAAQERLANYLDDPIDPISTNPIYLLEDAGFMIYPVTLGSLKLSYVKTGATPYWGYDGAGSILTLTNLVGGASYTNGTYKNVPIRGSYGINAKATIVVTGGSVTTVTLTDTGANFVIGNTLTTDNTFLGGTGNGFFIDVATVSSSQRSIYNPATSQDLLWKEKDQHEVLVRVLQKVGVNLMANQVSQYANQIKIQGE